MIAASGAINAMFRRHHKAIGAALDRESERTGASMRELIVLGSWPSERAPRVLVRRDFARALRELGATVADRVSAPPPGSIAACVLVRRNGGLEGVLGNIQLASEAELDAALDPNDGEELLRVDEGSLSLEALDLGAVKKAAELDEQSFALGTGGLAGWPERVCYRVLRLDTVDLLLRSALPDERARGFLYVTARRGRGESTLLCKRFSSPCDLGIVRELREIEAAYARAIVEPERAG